MKKIFLGGSPVSSIAGYALAGLMVAQELMDKGITSWGKIGLAVGVAVLGRIVADNKEKEA